jgi:hypothetical protein
MSSPKSAVGTEAMMAFACEIIRLPATFAMLQNGKLIGTVWANALDLAANVVFVGSLQAGWEGR